MFDLTRSSDLRGLDSVCGTAIKPDAEDDAQVEECDAEDTKDDGRLVEAADGADASGFRMP